MLFFIIWAAFASLHSAKTGFPHFRYRSILLVASLLRWTASRVLQSLPQKYFFSIKIAFRENPHKSTYFDSKHRGLKLSAQNQLHQNALKMFILKFHKQKKSPKLKLNIVHFVKSIKVHKEKYSLKTLHCGLLQKQHQKCVLALTKRPANYLNAYLC